MNWRERLVKTPESRKDNCWISPRGEWYNCDPTDHEEFAESVCLDLYGKEYDLRHAGENLVWEHEWIYVSSNLFEGTHVRGQQHMTPDQYMVLKEHWGDTRMFRGWTVDMMWAESKYKPMVLVSKGGEPDE